MVAASCVQTISLTLTMQSRVDDVWLLFFPSPNRLGLRKAVVRVANMAGQLSRCSFTYDFVRINDRLRSV